MPTPADNDPVSATPPSTHSCPPEDETLTIWTHSDMTDPNDVIALALQRALQQPTPPPQESPLVGLTDAYITRRHKHERVVTDDENTVVDMLSPISIESDKQDECELPARNGMAPGSPSDNHDFSNVRLTPSTPSPYLRPGSRFRGTQSSERQEYQVSVEIKHVDMRESFLCGYLRIKGLTEDHPELTTYFEGEIIGPKYSFHTPHEDWGASEKVDLQHWGKFPEFEDFKAQAKAKHAKLHLSHVAQRKTIFMRWKEHFLVPDHRIKALSGASFEGFYYICFNQLEGKVSGIYFHAKSEKFQQLSLAHVENRGCYASQEFR